MPEYATLQDEISARFPMFLEEALIDRIAETARPMTLQPGDELMHPGQYIKFIPLLLEGRIRITREDGEGGELLLYFLSSGQTCATSLSCCMADTQSSIRAVVEEEARLLAIPIRYLDEWMLEFPSWKNFIMRTYSTKFDELLSAFDAVAFLRMDERLIHYLAERRRAEGLKTAASPSANTLRISHQDIATELHTSREVISRLLKKLELDGKVQLGRNRIELLDPDAWLD